MEASISQADVQEIVGELKKRWKWLMFLGCLALFTGVVCIFVPVVASVTIAIFIGWFLIIGGILQFIDAFSVREAGRIALRLIGALVTLAIGIWLAIKNPVRGTETLTALLAIWFLVSGAIRLIGGLHERGTPGAGAVVFGGILSLILGGLILAELPSSAAWAIGLLVGIDLVFAGIALITTATAAKNS